MKTKTITVESGWMLLGGDPKAENDGYKVVKVTDSLEYTPGKVLPKATVEELCASRDWKVTVIEFNRKGR